MRTALLVALFLSRPLAGEPAKDKPKPTDWKDDPACRLVFHAVLEGLYEDGVSDAVVASIVPRDKKGDEKMRRSFVLECPLCRPAFEAFCAYQARPRFSDGSKAAAFGKGLAPEVEKALLSDSVPTRVIALRGPIRKWVEARLREKKLDAEEREKGWKDISGRAGEGTALLRARIKKDEWYKGWSGYRGCAACLGSTDACRDLGREKPKKQVPRALRPPPSATMS
ncbi:MAG: hypothetical protein K2W96_24720 [Gemmataceae bacterium]|nr:hypothetical protein [Gemmataceae bacterium]